MKEKHPELKVGILIFAGVAVLFIFTFMIGKFNFFKKGYDVKVMFNFVEGVEVGSPVRLSGVKAGSVTAIKIEPKDNFVHLTIWFQEGIKVKDDSKFYINTLGFMGEKYIEIDPGISSTYLKDGSVVTGEQSRRLEELIRQGTDIASEAGKIITSVRGATDKLSLNQLEAAIGDFRNIMKELNTSGTKILGNLNRTTSDLGEITSSKKEDVKAAIASLKGTIVKLDKSVTAMNVILDRIQNGEGTVGMLVSDKQVAADFKEIVTNLKSFSKDIKDNPQWLLMGKPGKK
jgi:phospholipid/cholesterol/gamma-HCH transport system substrate-binding protein